MKQRILRIATHPGVVAYVGLLVVAEVVNFVFAPFEEASGLWVSIAAIWFLVPIVAVIARGIVTGKFRWSVGAVFSLLFILGIVGGLAAYGFIYAFNRTTSPEVLVFESRSTAADYASRGGSRHELLTSDAGTTYEVDDPTLDDWDADHFWSTAKLGVSYSCQVLSSPALEWDEVYDCARSAGPRPSSANPGASPLPSNTGGAANSGAGTTPTAFERKTVSFTGILGNARLSLYVPTGSTVKTSSVGVTVSTPSFVVLIISVTTSSAASELSQTEVTHPKALADGVLTGAGNIGTEWAKNLPGGSINLLVPNGGTIQGFPYATIVAKTTGTISPPTA